MRIGEREHAVAESHVRRADADAVSLQPLPPICEASFGYLEIHFGRKAVAAARRRHLRPWKERQIGARTSFRIRVEQMIGAGIVLVHAALHEAHAENAGVEVEVLLRRTGDGRDVMEAVDAAHARDSIANRRLLIAD